MNRRLLIVGAGGLGRELSQYAADTWRSGEFEILGHLDDNTTSGQDFPLLFPYLGLIEAWEMGPTDHFLLAIGDPRAREKVAGRLRSRGGEFVTLVHPLAYVASSARVGYGSVVAPYATIGAGAQVGEFTNIHFYASAAHDTRIGSYVSLSPYAVANGQVVLGDSVFLGTRVTVNPTVKVGSGARVTSGSVVYRDVPENALASGNPAKHRQVNAFFRE